MITYIWFSSSQLYLILLPFSWLYRLITGLIRFLYYLKLFKVYRFPVSIVIVGNLTVGGNGKTPLVIWLVTQLQYRGWRVGVISRGYGGQAGCYPLVVSSTVTSEQSGDEPLLIWQRTKALVVVTPKRAEGVEALLRIKPLVNVIISDDGLQHYALGRDVELVVIDGERRFGNGCCLPAGPMREGIRRLKSVQAIIVNGGNIFYPGEIPMHLNAKIIINLLNGNKFPLSSLTSVVLIAGIGHPQRFFSMVRLHGIIPLREIVFKDHQIYQQKMFDSLISPGEQLLMTEKDAVKCRPFASSNWWYLPVDAQLSISSQKKLIMLVERSIYHYQKK